jgi:negative regulator of sigma E activity
MSAIGLPKGKDFVISAYADYRHDTLVFSRMQSQQLREMEWEGRLKPLQPWSAILGRAAIVAAVVATALLALYI